MKLQSIVTTQNSKEIQIQPLTILNIEKFLKLVDSTTLTMTMMESMLLPKQMGYHTRLEKNKTKVI